MTAHARLPKFSFFTALCFSFVLAAAPVLAADGYPWDGQITGNNVNVRSGSGTAYYPTQKLNDGQRVRVVGEVKGWFEIVPPTGSFSYIDRAAVEKHTNDLGTVTRDKAYVRAGSNVSRRKSQTQITLTTGDPVVILGEADGFYKIEPPEGVVVYVSKPYVQRIGNAPVNRTPVRTSTPVATNSQPIVVNTPVAQPVRSSAPVSEPIKVTPPVAHNPIRTTPPTVTPQPTSVSGSSGNTLVIGASNAKSIAIENDPNPPVVYSNPPAQTSTTITSTASSYNDPNEPLVIEPINTRNFSDPNPSIDNTNNSSIDLQPAARRPVATLPEWAQEGNGNTSSDAGNATHVITSTQSSYTSSVTTNTPTASVTTDTPTASTSYSSSTLATDNATAGGKVRSEGETLYIDAQPMKLVQTPIVAANSTPVRSESSSSYSSTDTTTVAASTPTTSTTVTNQEYITTAAPSDGSRLVHEYYGTGASRPAPKPINTSAVANNSDNTTSYESTTTYNTSTNNAYVSTPSVNNTYVDNTRTNNAYITNTSTNTTSATTTTVSDPFPVNNVNSVVNRPPPDFNPPPIPIRAEDGPFAAQLVAVELEMHSIFRMPIADRPYDQLIQKYRNIAVQADEPIPAQYAAIRAEQIERFNNIRRITMRYREDGTSVSSFQSQMSQSRISTLQSAGSGYVAGGTRFDYVGILKKSWAFEPERIRYRIVDPETDTTIIYLDIPSDVLADARPLLGKRVGVRISGQRFSADARVPIADASAIVQIAAGVLAEPIPISNNVWNGQNTTPSRPNSSTTAQNRGYDYGEAFVGTMTPVD